MSDASITVKAIARGATLPLEPPRDKAGNVCDVVVHSSFGDAAEPFHVYGAGQPIPLRAGSAIRFCWTDAGWKPKI